jgi:hypothetical protein
VPRLIAETSDTSHVDYEGLEDPMAQTVIPNLMRVGLVPERLVPGYLAQGFKVDLDAGTVKDVHTFHEETRATRDIFHAQEIDFSQAEEVTRAEL